MMGFKRIRPVITPDATLVAFYPGYGIAHVGRIRRPRRIRQWRVPDAGCDACRVLSDLRERNVGRIRRSRRIRQWRSAVAGCNACRVLSGQEDCTCGADKAFTPHPPAVANYAYGKIVIQHIQMRGTPGEIWCALLRLSAGCNFPELVHRRLTLWRAGRTYPPASGHHHDNRNAPSLSDQTRTDPPIRAHASRYQRQSRIG